MSWTLLKLRRRGDALDEDLVHSLHFFLVPQVDNIQIQSVAEDELDAAIDEGLSVKVNMVVKKGVNHNQIIPMADYFRTRNIQLRFIEYMDVGNSNQWDSKHVLPSEEVVKLLDRKFGVRKVGRKTASEVAEVWNYSGGGTFGTISSVSKPFCKNCSRARLSSDGLLYTCLFSSGGYDLKKYIREANFEQSDEESARNKSVLIEKLIQRVWDSRKDRYSEQRLTYKPKISERKIEMSYIGG